VTLQIEKIAAIIFDFANTLIEYGPRQIKRQNRVLVECLERLCGPCDREKLAAIRLSQITAPFRNNYRENLLPEICAELIHDLYGTAAEDDQIADLIQVRYDIFQQNVQLPPEVKELLIQLKKRYRLALLSNYPSRSFIMDALEQFGIADVFESIVISADIGYVKPHPVIFQRVLEELRLPPDRCLMIGDNWLADVQGARQLGIPVIHITQYTSYEKFEPQEGDLEPDLRISQLNELTKLLDL